MIKVTEVMEFLKSQGIKHRYVGNYEATFDIFCPLNTLKDDAITWVRNAEDLDVQKLNAISGLVLVAEYSANIQDADFPIIYAENAHRTFFRILPHFFADQDPDQREAKIEKTAVVETAQVGENLYVGHHTYIGPDVVIGNNVKVFNNVTIQGHVTIGDYTIIESGTTIGVCGFGQYWDENNNPVTVSHMGGVRIGSHVKIGANNSISRGCLADTIIEDYVQTDNLVHIAHNDVIKRGAILTANAVISGSTTIGSNAWLAPGSLVNNSVTVGDNAFFGIGAVATKDVPAGKVVVGMPAKVLRDRLIISKEG